MNSLQNHKMLNVMVAALVATATVAATATTMVAMEATATITVALAATATATRAATATAAVAAPVKPLLCRQRLLHLWTLIPLRTPTSELLSRPDS